MNWRVAQLQFHHFGPPPKYKPTDGRRNGASNIAHNSAAQAAGVSALVNGASEYLRCGLLIVLRRPTNDAQVTPTDAGKRERFILVNAQTSAVRKQRNP